MNNIERSINHLYKDLIGVKYTIPQLIFVYEKNRKVLSDWGRYYLEFLRAYENKRTG